MWNKIRSGSLPVALFLLVIISIILSFLIWTNPARYDRTRLNGAASTGATHSTVTTRAIDDIFLPTQVVVTNQQGRSETVYNPKINLVTSLKSVVEKWQMSDFRKISQGDVNAYQKLLNRHGMVQLVYADNIGRGIFNRSYGQKLLMSPTAKFSRIVFSTHAAGRLYLLNDDNQSIYQIHVRRQDLSQIRQLLSKANQRYRVTEHAANDHTLTYYEYPVRIPRYSYLVGKQSASFFVTSLLNTGESTSVTVHRTAGHTIYLAGTYKRMTVTNKTGAVQFEDYNANQKMTRDLGNNLIKSFNGLSKVGLPLDTIRYFDNEHNGHQVTYRSFVEGFPIFNQTDFGAVQVKHDQAGTQEINFTLTNLQVPLPTDSTSRVTLPSTLTVMNQLAAAGTPANKVKDIVLGYQWESNSDSNQVVDLQPTYYVYVAGKWQVYTDLLGE